MRFAKVGEDLRTEPRKGLHGHCPECESEVVSRCGEVRMHHWAHKPGAECSSWTEPETSWHREWKNEFPTKWQEVLHTDNKSGERHRADVRTLAGLVVEIQHSRLEPEERRSRESYYENMIWIVDASRLKGDRQRIENIRKEMRPIQKTENLFAVASPNEVFPTEWLNRPVPVLFDYNGVTPVEDEQLRNTIFLVYPGKVLDRTVVEPLNRTSVILNILGDQLTPAITRKIMVNLSRVARVGPGRRPRGR